MRPIKPDLNFGWSTTSTMKLFQMVPSDQNMLSLLIIEQSKDGKYCRIPLPYSSLTRDVRQQILELNINTNIGVSLVAITVSITIIALSFLQYQFQKQSKVFCNINICINVIGQAFAIAITPQYYYILQYLDINNYLNQNSSYFAISIPISIPVIGYDNSREHSFAMPI